MITTEGVDKAGLVAGGTSAVVLRDVTVGYDTTPVLTHADLEIGWGLMVGVIGPNGAPWVATLSASRR